MNGVIEVGRVLALLLLTGGAIGIANRKSFSPTWLLVAAGLVFLNDFLLSLGYGLLPHLISHSQWNWQGKILALAATLAAPSCQPSAGADRA